MDAGEPITLDVNENSPKIIGNTASVTGPGDAPRRQKTPVGRSAFIQDAQSRLPVAVERIRSSFP